MDQSQRHFNKVKLFLFGFLYMYNFFNYMKTAFWDMAVWI